MRTLLLLLFPMVLAAQQHYHAMAYYYPWYDAQHWEEGYWRAELQPPQQPLLGTYNSRDEAVIEQHLQWSETYGIDSWAVSWWGKRSWSDGTIRKALLPAFEGRTTRFCIFYESLKRLGGLQGGRINFAKKQIRRMKRDFRYLARRFFGHPNYLKVEGKAVVVLYLTRTYRGQYKEALAAARRAARSKGFELYLVGDEVFWNPPERKRIRQLDAITAYNMHGPWQFKGYPQASGFFEMVEAQYRRFREIARREAVDFIPNAFPGFNDLGVRPEVGHYIIPPRASPEAGPISTFERYLEIAKRMTGSPLHIVAITSFNEWHEDTQIEPLAPADRAGKSAQSKLYDYPGYGMDLLRAVQRLLGP